MCNLYSLTKGQQAIRGLRTRWHGTRGTKADPVEGEHELYGFLITEAIAQLDAESESLLGLTLPAETYPGQRASLPTVAVAALLVGREDLDPLAVTTTLEAVFERIDFLAAGSGAGAQIATAHGLDGVSLRLHPAAEDYFVQRR